ncbi:MAG: GWxTD domain-containing protein [Bacteroidales bacterium]|nr:GWxTD domain-containing protein [Bacteroidales bacterium]
MRRLNKYYLYFFVLWVFNTIGLSLTAQTNSLVENQPSYKYNFSSIYNPTETVLHPLLKVYSDTDTSAIVFFKLNMEELRKLSKNRLDTICNLTIKYALRDVETFQIIDSGAYIVKINLVVKDNFFESYIRVYPKTKVQHKLIVGFAAGTNNAGSRLIMDLDNSEEYSSNTFLIEQLQDNSHINYYNFVDSAETYRIQSKKLDGYDISIEYYKPFDDIVVPPYFSLKSSDEIIKPDSVFSYRIGDSISFERIGAYVLKPSSQSAGAMCLLNFGQTYPDISILLDMMEPIQLISTSKDFQKIKESENLKMDIDSYWLDLSKNQKFAREQIRVFYNRVSLANRFFSDYQPGWKTDRGMLYVVLGPPTIVNISARGEEWFYGENPEVAGILFQYEKRSNIYSGYEYRMFRDELYQTIWSQAIATWRNGRVFTITKN